MHFLELPCLRRIYNVLQIAGLFLLSSCQSDPILLNPPGGYEYLSQTFYLDTSTSYTSQGYAHTGHSPRFYSGILSSGETVSALIRLLPHILDTHQVCTADSIANVKVVLTSTTPIAVQNDTTFIDTLIQLDSLKIFLVPSYDIGEDAVIDSTILSEIMALSKEILTDSLETYYSLEINLFDYDPTIMSRWCDNPEELGILIFYSPTNSSYLEFFSSDNTEGNFGPRLTVEYAVEEATSNTYYNYSFKMVTWSDELIVDMNSGPYYVDDPLSSYWGTFYAMDLDEPYPVISNPPINYDSVVVQTDIFSDAFNTPHTLLQINVELNSEILDELDSITFSLNNAFVFRSNTDPAGDNKTEANPDGTENNLTYEEEEVFNDNGWDNCPDELEIGNNSCASSEEESAFNLEGTEGNNKRDWSDYNINGKWDDGEGEEWGDWGFDGCPDSLETGGNDLCDDGPPCNCSSESHSDYDLNNDNVDPAGDDWHAETNLDGTEGNGVWNSGEPFYDFGTDGVSANLPGVDPDENDTEGNVLYELGEPFHDTGSDGLFNIDEPGWNENRTEGNNEYDDGEFFDCGIDNCCDSDDDLNICDEETDDNTDDNYNKDPNEDNWNDCGTDGICDEENPDVDETEGNGIWEAGEKMEKNHILDWTDATGVNGVLWDTGEGEQWFDWGIDGVHDTLEAFQISSVIFPYLYDNNYIFDINEGTLEVSLDLVADTVSLWISKISQTENSLTIDVSVQTHIALQGLQFQLTHIPYTRVDTILQTYEPSITIIEEEKLFEDFTLFPKVIYSNDQLMDTLLIDYANDVSILLDFDGLDLFLANEEYIISNKYSKLIMYVDSALTDYYDNDMLVYINRINSLGNDELLTFPIEISSATDSIEIPMGQILREYQHGSLGSYDGLKLKLGGNRYNYSKLSIQYNLGQSVYNPRLEIMYTQ